MRRTLFEPEHEFFRDTVRRCFETEFLPRNAEWEAAGEVSREAWREMGRQGWLCTLIPEEYGGAGVDERYAAILLEEQYRLGLTGPGWSLHSDIIAYSASIIASSFNSWGRGQLRSQRRALVLLCRPALHGAAPGRQH